MTTVLDDGYPLDMVQAPGSYTVKDPDDAPATGEYYVEVFTGKVSNSVTQKQVITNLATGAEFVRVYVRYTGWSAWTERGAGGGVDTDLTVGNKTATTLDVLSSTGADATIPAATDTEAGLFTAAMKTKLDGIAESADPFVSTDLAVANKTATTLDVTSSTGSDATLPAATDTEAGLFTAAQKTKLDGVAANANNYSHPSHTGDVTSVGDGATTIASDAVTNSKLANMAANTIKGNNSGSTGDPADLTAAQVRTVLGAREVLTTDRTYYVRTDGSDSNDGLANTAGGAFLTIQQAIDTIASTIDLGAYSVTIQVGNGTYTGQVTPKSYVGAGPVIIQGDTTTPTNVVISVTSNNAINMSGVVGGYKLRGVKLQTTTTGFGISMNNGSVLGIANINFGAVPTNYSHMIIQGNSVLTIEGNYTISGSAPSGRHWYASQMGLIQVIGSWTVTITGTPSFGIVALCDRMSYMMLSGLTYSGSATGARYSALQNSIIYTNAGTLPGDSAGSTGTGGQYL
jgi:hypothetical protein